MKITGLSEPAGVSLQVLENTDCGFTPGLQNMNLEDCHFAESVMQTASGPVMKVRPRMSLRDRIGQVRARLTRFRMKYRVEPGLYALGHPDENSPVLTSANYKLSFDILRTVPNLDNAWILVLDTGGINVWCAAGKGTFGTDELIKRIRLSRIHEMVSHRKIIVPQLGAVGVRAAAVQKSTGFRVYFGPVDARHLPEYIENEYTAHPKMRMVRFNMYDRLVLTPMEMVPALKKFPGIAFVFLLLFGIQQQGIMYDAAIRGGLPFILLTLAAVITGAFLTPLLLPYLPTRWFSIKGLVSGAVVTVLLVHGSVLISSEQYLLSASAYLLFPVLSSYLALMFTGSTAFTGISGVQKEMKAAIPVYIVSIGIALVLIVLYKLKSWGIL